MSLQLSVAVRNAELDSIETTIGSSPKLQIWTGSPPANCAAADASETKLVEITCPANFLADASGGAKALAGSWSVTGIADGTAGHFRLKDSTGTTCHAQGTCGIGTGDLQLSNTSIATGQTVTVTAFTLTAGNA